MVNDDKRNRDAYANRSGVYIYSGCAIELRSVVTAMRNGSVLFVQERREE